MHKCILIAFAFYAFALHFISQCSKIAHGLEQCITHLFKLASHGPVN